MAVTRVTLHRDIQAPLAATFDWFYRSEHFTQSPIVFRSRWRGPRQWEKGAKRDIIMIAGWYAEEITEVVAQRAIRYRVNRSFPAVRQDFTELTFDALSPAQTRVTWTIEIEVRTPVGQRWLNALAGQMARTLYGTILTAGQRALEAS